MSNASHSIRVLEMVQADTKLQWTVDQHEIICRMLSWVIYW